jgi:hypothetical protein
MKPAVEWPTLYADHSSKCDGKCAGVMKETVFFSGHGIWNVFVPACSVYQTARQAKMTIIAKSGLRFVKADKARKLFRTDRFSLGQLPHMAFSGQLKYWLASDLIATFPLRRYYCDLCRKSVKPEVPSVFKFPEVKYVCREHRDRSEVDRLAKEIDREFGATDHTGPAFEAAVRALMDAHDRAPVTSSDYYYKIVPGKMKQVRACKHCARYRLPRERKDQLWRQQQAEDRVRERETMEGCKNQIRALKKYLKDRNPEVLQSLPKEFGPAEISPTSCPPS